MLDKEEQRAHPCRTQEADDGKRGHLCRRAHRGTTHIRHMEADGTEKSFI